MNATRASQVDKRPRISKWFETSALIGAWTALKTNYDRPTDEPTKYPTDQQTDQPTKRNIRSWGFKGKLLFQKQ